MLVLEKGGISPKGEQKDAIRRLHWQRSFSVAAYWIQQEQTLLSVFDHKFSLAIAQWK